MALVDAVDRYVKRIEAAEELDRFSAPLAAAISRLTKATLIKNALSGTWLGHQLHPLLTDIPIGSWVAAATLDIAGGQRYRHAARRLVGLGSLAALPTALAGASDWADTYGPEQRDGLVHMAANLTALSLQSASYFARRRGMRLTGAVLTAGGLGLMTCAAYLGGHLTYIRGVGVNHTAFEDAVSTWTDVAAFDDLAEGRPMAVAAGGVPVVLVRQDGQIYALSATCVHAGGPLAEGSLADGSLRCPWHGSVYRLSDGKPLRGPAATAQPVWEARVRQQRVQVRSARR